MAAFDGILVSGGFSLMENLIKSANKRWCIKVRWRLSHGKASKAEPERIHEHQLCLDHRTNIWETGYFNLANNAQLISNFRRSYSSIGKVLWSNTHKQRLTHTLRPTPLYLTHCYCRCVCLLCVACPILPVQMSNDQHFTTTTTTAPLHDLMPFQLDPFPRWKKAWILKIK